MDSERIFINWKQLFTCFALLSSNFPDFETEVKPYEENLMKLSDANGQVTLEQFLSVNILSLLIGSILV